MLRRALAVVFVGLAALMIVWVEEAGLVQIVDGIASIFGGGHPAAMEQARQEERIYLVVGLVSVSIAAGLLRFREKRLESNVHRSEVDEILHPSRSLKNVYLFRFATALVLSFGLALSFFWVAMLIDSFRK